MKASELRLGNLVWFQITGETVKINGNDIADLANSMDSEIFQPIPITEEWLVKFGFENIDTYYNEKQPYKYPILLVYNKEPNMYELTITRTPSMYADKGVETFIFSPDDKGKNVFIRYVHQLQNLYFALTGNELTLK